MGVAKGDWPSPNRFGENVLLKGYGNILSFLSYL